MCGNSGVETLVALGAGDKIAAAVLTEAEDKGRLQALLPNTRIIYSASAAGGCCSTTTGFYSWVAQVFCR